MSEEPKHPAAAGARRGRRRLLRLAFRLALLAPILLLCFLHLLPAITDTAAFRSLVARGMGIFLRDPEVRIGRLRVGPLRRDLFLMEDFTLAPRGMADRPLVKVGRVAVRWLPRDLFRGRVRITDVEVRSVELALIYEDGQWNFARLLKPSAFVLPRLPVSVWLDRAVLADSSIAVHMPGVLDVTVEGVQAEAGGRVEGAIEGSAVVSAGARSISVRAGPLAAGLPAGFHAVARAQNVGGAARLALGAYVPAVQADVPGLIALGPVPAAVGFDARLDLPGLDVPEANCHLTVPGIVDDWLRLSVTRGDGFALEGENLVAADLGGALGAVHASFLEPVSLQGRLSVRTRLTGSVGVSPRLRIGLRAETDAHLDGLAAAASVVRGGRALEADLEGGGADVRHVLDAVWDKGLVVLNSAAVAVRADRCHGALGGLADVELDRPSAQCLVRASVPPDWRRAGLDAGARLAIGGVGLEVPGRARVSLPVEARVGASLRDVLDLGAVTFALDGPHGSAGAVAPAFDVRASLGPGLAPFSFHAGGATDVGAALGLLDGLAEPLRALLPTVSARGLAAGSLDVAGRLPIGGPADVRLRVGGMAHVADAALARGDVSAGADAAVGFADAGLALDRLFQPHGATLRAWGAVDGARATQSAAGVEAGFGHADASVTLSLDEPAAPLLHAQASGRVVGPQVAFGGGAGLLPEGLPIGGGAALEVAPLSGDLTVSSAAFGVPNLVECAVEGAEVRGLGIDGVRLQARGALPDLSRVRGIVAERLPERLARWMPNLAGTAAARVEVNGRLPVVQDLLASLLTGRGLPKLELLPLASFWREKVPLDLRATLELKDVAVSEAFADAPAVGLRGIAVQAGLDMTGGSAEGTVRLSVPGISVGALPLPSGGLSFESAVALEEFDRLRVSGFRFEALGGLAEAGGDLLLGGLARLHGLPTPAWLLQNLRVDLSSEGVLRPGKLDILKGLISGEMGGRVHVLLEPGSRLLVAAVPRLESVSAAYGDLFALSGLNGGFTFEKEWRIVPEGSERTGLTEELTAPTPAPAENGLGDDTADFGTAVDAMVDAGEGLTLGSADALGRRVLEDVRVEMTARGARVSVPRFYLHTLGGQVVGRLSFDRVPDGRLLEVEGEFADVDFRDLLPAELRDFSGDATVYGTFGGSALFARGGEAALNPVKDLGARLDVTHIGADALGRLLLALDPRGERPPFVRLRQALRLGGPRTARARLTRGLVSADVELQGLPSGLISSYTLPSVSVAELLGSPQVRRVFGLLAPAMLALDALEADSIEVREDGSVAFK